MLSYAPIKRTKIIERSYIEQKLVDYMAKGNTVKVITFAEAALPIKTDYHTLESFDDAIRYTD